MPGADTSIAVAARITGRVQGVWFRGWVREEARRLGLTGLVRNEPDGSVAALFAGQETAVAARWHRYMGSRSRLSTRSRSWRSLGWSGEGFRVTDTRAQRSAMLQ
jgi:acylphosphatase